ncbi:unnamed protein product [Knipowitschia caucasica]
MAPARKRVIDLVRCCKDTIVLTVLQPHQSPKSAFISAAKKARLRTNPPKVRFSEQVSISDPDSTMLKDDSLLLIPNVLKVFLENGQIKSFTFDSRTTVRDVIASLQDRLSLRYIEHFALVLEAAGMDHHQRLQLLQENQPLTHVVHRTYFQGMKCLFRVCFFPKDPSDLLRRDPAAFEYLYIQSRNDVIKERFGIDWKSDITLRLAALHIFITVSSARPSQKISLKHVEKEWGLEPFLPLTLLPLVKEKNVCKSLSQLLKTYQHAPPSGNKVPPLQGKLQYMRVLNDLPPFGGILFNTVEVDEKQSATTLLVGPRHGISHVIDLKNNLTTVLAEFSRVSKVQLYRESQGVARVEVSMHDSKPLVLLMEWPDATNFACLISGYYKLFVDPKRTIFFRNPAQSQLTKTDYRSSFHGYSRSGASSLPSGGRRGDDRESSHRESGSLRASAPAEPQHLGLCHVHLRERDQHFQEFQTATDTELDINENFIPQDPTDRPRTKSDPTLQSTEEIPTVPDIAVKENTEFRIRAQAVNQSQKNTRYFCDSCKARLRAEGVVINSSGSSGKHCSSSCASRDGGAVDLTALPPPGNELEDEEEVTNGTERLQLPTPAIAAPPPGFRDNSSDEDDTKRGRKARTGLGSRIVAVNVAQAKEDVPVTLIDNVSTRTVRDHAQELDDALVSTLQALEALAASEDYPHHSQQPTQTAGLIVLAAITPESSLDSGHETNSSELTDVSEMMSAMKQNQSQTYLLAHHINKDRIICRRDFPLAIPGCTAKTIGTGAFSVGQIRAGCPPKQVILSKTVPFKVSPGQDSAILRVMAEQASSHDALQSEHKALIKANIETSKVKTNGVPDKSFKEAKLSEMFLYDPKLTNSILEPQGQSIAESNQVNTLTSTKKDSNKASPIISPVDITASAKIAPNCKDAETVSSETIKPFSAIDVLPVDDLFCTCPVQQESVTQLRPKDPQIQKVVMFQSSSPTDDERLRAKGLQITNMKENVVKGGEEPSLGKPSPQLQTKYSPRQPVKSDTKDATETKAEVTQTKSHTETTKPKSLPILDDPTATCASVGKVSTLPTRESKKQGTGKMKSHRSAPFLSFRNLLSATFPARMRRETDERRAQLQKVRQYEMEFLEELLKPKSSQGEFLPQGSSPVPGGTPCACQLRTSPVLKAPGISREQRRSCDCKRMCRGMRLPDTPVGSITETQQRGRERNASKTPPSTSHTPGSTRRPQTLEIKTTRIRSTSLESRKPRGEAGSGLPSSVSHTDGMAAPQQKKLQRRYSFGELDNNTNTPVYAEVKPKAKSLEKEMERVRATGLRLPTPIEPVHIESHQADVKVKKGVFFIQGEDQSEGKEGAPEVVLTLPTEDIHEREKCCSFCFCYRKCEAADESSEKDELSYSIPLQVLPGMELDSHTFPVVSKTLQVLNAEDCSGEEEEVEEEDPHTQEIDLRACGTQEGSLARVQALQEKTFSLPDGFLNAQLDANELLAILRQCANSPQAEGEGRLQPSRITEYKQELAVRFKEFRASCRRVASVEKSPSRMLAAVTASFQVLCELTQTFIKLIRGVRSEAQRLQLLRKVEEVAVNYTLLLRAAEESMGHSSSLPTKTVTPQVPSNANNMNSLSRPIKTLPSQ